VKKYPDTHIVGLRYFNVFGRGINIKEKNGFYDLAVGKTDG